MVVKEWHLTAGTDDDLAMAVYGVFSSLSRVTDPVVRLIGTGESSQQTTTGHFLDLDVYFTCGEQRTIIIEFQEFEDLESGPPASVTERLGNP